MGVLLTEGLHAYASLLTRCRPIRIVKQRCCADVLWVWNRSGCLVGVATWGAWNALDGEHEGIWEYKEWLAGAAQHETYVLPVCVHLGVMVACLWRGASCVGPQPPPLTLRCTFAPHLFPVCHTCLQVALRASVKQQSLCAAYSP